jgi:hypothetical protein
LVLRSDLGVLPIIAYRDKEEVVGVFGAFSCARFNWYGGTPGTLCLCRVRIRSVCQAFRVLDV